MKKKKTENLIFNRNIEALNENIKTLNNKKLSLKEKSNKNIGMFLSIVAFFITGDTLLMKLANYENLKNITIIGIIISVFSMIFLYFYFYIETFKKS
ncbi:hypothetical protein SNJ89_14580 [Clostridium perfringens]|uniref:hypothetical protein n=1 Tax=Clostridium perfringens TaxID=1502 RepID=UPI0018E4CB4E|nr:hypothetical protein [Clostridium perfringens]MBI5977829.1 hypothetical protein [Clostridium perfringens]MBI5980760.1 hypothetical protein [Clostridium perfringens]MBI5983030.1 hypothetical protein [Clostridium perfringens]MBI5989432.1 hypothetical protein [Clostridium perfringens]MBI5994853.1 hypothetical protein [Clostridium perfringens]